MKATNSLISLKSNSLLIAPNFHLEIQFSFRYNEMCKSRLVAFFNEWNKTYTNSDSEIKAVLDRLAAQGKSEGNKHGKGETPISIWNNLFKFCCIQEFACIMQN